MVKKGNKCSHSNKKEHLEFVKILKKLKKEDRSKIIPYLKNECIDFLCECFYNVLFVDLGLKKNKKNIIKNKLKTCCIKRLKTIASKNKPLEAKKSS